MSHAFYLARQAVLAVLYLGAVLFICLAVYVGFGVGS